jgi:4-amino-4-deoxy-L-arabinose transferase-like glycosyltransferase
MLCVVGFSFQGTRGIWEPDEGRYTSAGINMHESGNWLVPTVDGHSPHLTKPPIVYWALATSFALFGHNEWAARVPSALAYIGTGLFVFGLGRRLCPARPWLPAAVWGLSLAPVIAANVVSTDPLLAFFETAAMFAFVEGWSRSQPEARRWFVAMWIAWGLAFMTKGPPGLLPLLAMCAYLGVHDRARLRDLFVPLGLVLFVPVAFTWFLILVAQEPGLLHYFLGNEMYDRVFTNAYGRNDQWYGAFTIYLPVLVLGTLPWSVLAIVTSGGVRPTFAKIRQRLAARDRHWLLLAYWFLVPLAVFFLARSRLHLYVLPLFVPLALAMARPLSRWPRLQGRTLFAACAVAAAAFVTLKGTLSHVPSNRDARETAAALGQLLDPHDIDRIVFVDMRPFYGLNMYLDRKVEGLHIGERRFDYSRFVETEELCREVAQPSRAVYAMKRQHAPRFTAAVRQCGAQAVHIGMVEADENKHEIFLVAMARRH